MKRLRIAFAAICLLLLSSGVSHAAIMTRLRVSTAQSFVLSGSYVLTIPSWVVNGDLMIAVLTYSGTGGGPATPSGWTKIADKTAGSPVATNISTYYRTASSEGASVTFTSVPTTFMGGYVACFFDTDGATVAFDTSSSTSTNSGTSLAQTALTPASGNSDPLAAILAIWGCDASTTVTPDLNGQLYHDTVDTSANRVAENSIIYPSAKGVASIAPSATITGAATSIAGQQVALKITGTASAGRLAIVGQCHSIRGQNVTSLSVSVPLNVSNGDLLIAFVMASAGGVSQASFTSVTSQDSGKWTVWKRTASSEPTSYSFSMTSSTFIQIVLIVVRSLDAKTLSVDTQAVNGPTSATSLATPTVTTGGANELVICSWAEQGSGTPGTLPTAATDFFGGNKVAQNSARHSASSLFEQATAGATSSRTMSTSASTTWYGAQVAISQPQGGKRQHFIKLGDRLYNMKNILPLI